MRRIGGSLKASLRASAKLKSFIGQQNSRASHPTVSVSGCLLHRATDYFQ
ncbi:hypothetical protein [uncultured Kingella sp.]|nr:hypothetical protein [uncultured Kingella sp.]